VSLESRGYTAEWMASQDEAVRVTVEILHRKLSGLDLWRFVSREWKTKRGRLQFECDDVPGLKTKLIELGFTRPADSTKAWESSERAPKLSLHMKHFDGWEDNKVQAHIDRAGFWLARKWWWFPPYPLAQMLHHFFHYKSYLDVERLRDMMDR